MEVEEKKEKAPKDGEKEKKKIVPTMVQPYDNWGWLLVYVKPLTSFN